MSLVNLSECLNGGHSQMICQQGAPLLWSDREIDTKFLKLVAKPVAKLVAKPVAKLVAEPVAKPIKYTSGPVVGVQIQRFVICLHGSEADAVAIYDVGNAVDLSGSTILC
jgi:hypothetical protein